MLLFSCEIFDLISVFRLSNPLTIVNKIQKTLLKNYLFPIAFPKIPVIMILINNSEVGFYASSVRWMGSRLETKSERACTFVLRYIIRTRCYR